MAPPSTPEPFCWNNVVAMSKSDAPSAAIAWLARVVTVASVVCTEAAVTVAPLRRP